MLHLVSAIIEPHTLEEVAGALRDVGVTDFTVTEVRSFSRPTHARTYRGAEYQAELATKLKLEVVVPTALASMVGELVATNARTRCGSDGRAWITPIDWDSRTDVETLADEPLGG